MDCGYSRSIWYNGSYAPGRLNNCQGVDNKPINTEPDTSSLKMSGEGLGRKGAALTRKMSIASI